jgi:hypothetical protein
VLHEVTLCNQALLRASALRTASVDSLFADHPKESNNNPYSAHKTPHPDIPESTYIEPTGYDSLSSRHRSI